MKPGRFVHTGLNRDYFQCLVVDLYGFFSLYFVFLFWTKERVIFLALKGNQEVGTYFWKQLKKR